VLDTIRRRVQRLLRHRGLEPGDEGTAPDDPLAEASLALAGLMGASVQGRVALGPRAGARVRQLGDGPTAATSAGGPRQAHVEGFDLHANVWVGAHDRARLEHLCRYLLRPPLADDRLPLLGDGRVRAQLKRAWSDGTTHLLFEPVEFLEKLAALTPRPAINLILYQGLLAPHSRWRPDAVVYGRPARDAATRPKETVGRADGECRGAARPRYWTWAALMRRAFDVDVLCCPRCAGRMGSTTPLSFTGSSRTSGCPEPATVQSPRSLSLAPETISPRSPSRTRSDLAGPADRGGRLPAPSAVPWCPAPLASRPLRFDHSHGLWQDRRTMRGALSALCQAGLDPGQARR